MTNRPSSQFNREICTNHFINAFHQTGLLSDLDLNYLDQDHNYKRQWTVSENCQLVVSTDSLIENVHFLENTAAGDIAFKSLAVNLSDLAAMAATPKAIGLTLLLPELNESWANEFATVLSKLSLVHKIDLVNFQAHQGELAIHVQIYGEVEVGRALTRSAAKKGDLICVSGFLGDAAYGLKILKEGLEFEKNSDLQYLVNRLLLPTPRVELGRLLGLFANACIDLSDGLLADLGHICRQSKVGAIIELTKLPLSEPLRHVCDEKDLTTYALSCGDDYELCFTLEVKKYSETVELCQQRGFSIHQIGTIVQEPGVKVYDGDKEYTALNQKGFEHFQV